MEIDKETLIKLYITEMKTDKQIAKIFNIHHITVYRTRKKMGIKAIKRTDRNICNPTREQIDFIYGCLLGDGSITNGKKDKYVCNSRFSCKHCVKQKDYLYWKYNILKNLCKSEPKELKNGQWRINTFYHPYFSNLRKLFYPQGYKIVPQSILESITPLGLAVWFMDDGRRQKNGIELCTCSFDERSMNLLSVWLYDKFNILNKTVTHNNYPYIQIKKESREKWLEIVEPHMVPCMKYKLNKGN